MFVSKAVVYPSVASTQAMLSTFQMLHSRVGSGLTHKPARDKQSSLLRKFVKHRRKKYYYIGPWYANR